MKINNLLLVLFFGLSLNVFSQCHDNLVADYLTKLKKTKKTNLKERSAYMQLTKYYQYTCECEKGTDRPKELVILINRIVDVNKKYYHNKYAVLNRVTSCKSIPSKR